MYHPSNVTVFELIVMVIDMYCGWTGNIWSVNLIIFASNLEKSLTYFELLQDRESVNVDNMCRTYDNSRYKETLLARETNILEKSALIHFKSFILFRNGLRIFMWLSKKQLPYSSARTWRTTTYSKHTSEVNIVLNGESAKQFSGLS